MRLKNVIRVAVVLWGILFPHLIKAFDNPAVSYLGIEHGLSNNSVTCVFQDHKGFMWFGTYDGLNRYDGYNFKIFRNQLNDSSSLPNNRIAAITEDAAKRLWVGTRSGISIYDQVTSSFSPVYYMPFGGGIRRKISATVNQIKLSSNGNIFIATENGLLLYSEKTGVAEPLPIAAAGKEYDYQASAIEFDKANHVWVYVREKGLFLYDEISRSLKLVSPQVKNGICLNIEATGSLCLGTDDGLYAYSNTENKFSKKFSSGNRILQLAGYDNKLYIVTDGNGVFTYDYATKQTTDLFAFSSRKLTSPCVYSILQDPEGRLWIGTMRGGINVIDNAKNKFLTVANNPLNTNSLIDNFVTSCCEDADENLWVGTDGNGISCWNRKQHTFTSFRRSFSTPQLRSSNFITDLLNDDENIWVASWGGGVDRFNKKTHNFQHFNCYNTDVGQEDKNPFLLYKDKKQRVWAGTCLEGGLYRFNQQAKKFELYDSRLKNILAMYQDTRDVLWAGDFSSLIQIDEIKKMNYHYKLGYAIRSILEDKKGNFWIGTEGGGILLFNRSNGSYVRFSENQGLCNNSVLKILEDGKGNLWISTFNGISVFNTDTKKFRNFSQSDGLQSNQFNYNTGLKLHSGEFVFGGIKGLNVFYPDSILRHSVKPLNVLLTGVKIDNAPIGANSSFVTKRTIADVERIELPYNKAAIAIDFAALNYSASDKIKYAYYLEGWDKGWNYVGRNKTANYTRLKEGVYTFHVKAIDDNGNENEWGSNLIIEILPPWRRTWWAYLIYISIGCAFIYMYVRYKSQQAEHKYEIALARIETEKEKELNEKKLLFFTNIAHEFRSPLTLIIDPVKELLHQPEKRTSASGLEMVYRNARRLLSLVDQLLVFRKADIDGDKLNITRTNFYEFCHEIFICFSQQAAARNINYEFSGSNTLLEIGADREKMEIILFNLLSNALKFTPAGGTVKLEIAEQPENTEMIKVSVSDTGCGIEKGAGNRLFEKFYQGKSSQNTGHKGFGIGLYLVNQFVKAHGGTLTYESVMDKGTKFIINLPLNLALNRLTPDESPTDEKKHERRPVLVKELIADLEADTDETNELKKGQEEISKVIDSLTLPKVVSEKKSILIVDDNKSIRQYLNQVFEDNFLVYEAENGETGLTIAQNNMPDIIISDVVMDGMSGVDFCKAVKANPDLSHIPVILLTASTSSDIKLKGLECGAEDYITKPFEKDLLIARVDNIIKNRNILQQYFLDTITLRRNNAKVSGEFRDFLERCIVVIEKEIENEDFSIKSFTRKMGMSHSSLYKKVKSVSGLSLNAFIRFLRLRKAALLLLSTDTNINQAAFQVGINDLKYFRAQFYKLFGMNPSEYIKKYKNSFNKDINLVITAD